MKYTIVFKENTIFHKITHAKNKISSFIFNDLNENQICEIENSIINRLKFIIEYIDFDFIYNNSFIQKIFNNRFNIDHNYKIQNFKEYEKLKIYNSSNFMECFNQNLIEKTTILMHNLYTYIKECKDTEFFINICQIENFPTGSDKKNIIEVKERVSLPLNSCNIDKLHEIIMKYLFSGHVNEENEKTIIGVFELFLKKKFSRNEIYNFYLEYKENDITRKIITPIMMILTNHYFVDSIENIIDKITKGNKFYFEIYNFLLGQINAAKNEDLFFIYSQKTIKDSKTFIFLFIDQIIAYIIEHMNYIYKEKKIEEGKNTKIPLFFCKFNCDSTASELNSPMLGVESNDIENESHIDKDFVKIFDVEFYKEFKAQESEYVFLNSEDFKKKVFHYIPHFFAYFFQREIKDNLKSTLKCKFILTDEQVKTSKSVLLSDSDMFLLKMFKILLEKVSNKFKTIVETYLTDLHDEYEIGTRVLNLSCNVRTRNIYFSKSYIEVMNFLQDTNKFNPKFTETCFRDQERDEMRNKSSIWNIK
jgi:hypothetical protein